MLSDGTVVMRPKTRRLAGLAGSLTRARRLAGTEWVLRSRYTLDKASIAGAFTALLEKAPTWSSNTPRPWKRRCMSGRATQVPTSPTACSRRAPQARP
jgi:hypothetical protein